MMRKIVSILAVLLAVASCQLDTTVDTGFALYYAGVTEICPGTNITLTPTWHGQTPTDYAISSVTLNSRPYETDCFTVDSSTGIFSASGTDALPTGNWTVGISCVSAGEKYTYDDAVEFTLMKAVPEGIYVEPDYIEVDLGDIVAPADTTVLPTAQILTDGNNHVSIKKYLLSNVYRNGVPVEECKKWFTLSKEGLFSINPENAEFEPGTYTFDFRLTTYACGEDAEDGLFQRALKLNVKSKPLALTYKPASMKIEAGYGGKTTVPSIKGSPDGLVYKIKSVSPTGVNITIDEVTGQIKFPEDSPAKIGETYVVSVTAENKFGAASFEDIYTFNIIEFIRPITVFSYEDVGEKISGVGFSNKIVEVDGDEVSFLFKDLPAGLAGLKIDSETGEITCEKGTELEPGDYNVEVIARNPKDDFPATFKLKVLKNPYKFTTVFWGNNMGLTPEEDYGNQFRSFWDDDPLVIPVKYSDIPEGVPVSFKYQFGYQYSSSRTGVSIDNKTGTVTICPTSHIVEHYTDHDLHYYYSKTDYNANRVHVGWVTVTVGGTDEAAVTKIFPFFVQHVGYSGSYVGFTDGNEHSVVTGIANEYAYQVLYTPFAFRVNPKKGGKSTPPVVSHLDGRAINGFTLDYRRGFCYYNFYGPEQHGIWDSKYGVMSATNKNLLYTLWGNYASATGTTINVGAASAVGYWANKNYLKNWLGNTACYVDPTDLSMVVNPEKWQDDYGYANGAFVANMAFNINNNDPSSNSNTDMQTLPIIVWLDDTYNK